MDQTYTWIKMPHWLAARTDVGGIDKVLWAILVDRIGENGECWPGQRQLAKDCGCDVGTINRSVARLLDSGLIELASHGRFDGDRKGRTARYKIGKNVGILPTFANGQRLQSATPTCAKRNTNVAECKQNHTKGTTPNEPDQSKQAEEIFEAYPRRVAKLAALKAIRKALVLIQKRNGVSDPAAWLLSKVREFAQSPDGRAGKFTPHPASWFNAGKFDDDPAEWSRRSNDSAPGRVTVPPGKYARFNAPGIHGCPPPKQSESGTDQSLPF